MGAGVTQPTAIQLGQNGKAVERNEKLTRFDGGLRKCRSFNSLKNEPNLNRPHRTIEMSFNNKRQNKDKSHTIYKII